MHDEQADQPEPIEVPEPMLAVTSDRPPMIQPTPPRHSEAGWLRLVIVVWCFWLLGAWAMAWVSESSVPRVRWMLFAGTFGLMVVWPAFRLSERNHLEQRDGGAASPVILDWLGLILVYQAVIWSLHLIAHWPLARGLWLDAVIVSWSLLTALIVALARRWPFAWARTVGMALCVGLVFAEPIAIWSALGAGHEGWSMRVSPIQALWELTESPTQTRLAPWDQRTMLVGLIAIVGWLALGCWSLGEKMVGSGTISKSA